MNCFLASVTCRNNLFPEILVNNTDPHNRLPSVSLLVRVKFNTASLVVYRFGTWYLNASDVCKYILVRFWYKLSTKAAKKCT